MNIQVCLGWHRTGAYDTAKLTFSHDFPISVWGAYCTSVRIIFEFLRYLFNTTIRKKTEARIKSENNIIPCKVHACKKWSVGKEDNIKIEPRIYVLVLKGDK